MYIQYELRLIRIQCERKQCELISFQCALLSYCEHTLMVSINGKTRTFLSSLCLNNHSIVNDM